MGKMTTLASKYAEACARAERAWQDAENAKLAMAKFVQSVSEKYAHNEDLRRSKVKDVQREYYVYSIVGNEVEDSSLDEMSAHEREAYANALLDKKTRTKKRAVDPSQYRSADEERVYTNLRVRWSRLMELCDVPAVDSRGGPR